MSKAGFIPLYRKFQDNFLWQERRVFSKAEAWLDILMEVQWKEDPKECSIKNKRLVCNYGECLYSLETWARRWGWNKSKVRRVLDLFQSCNMIEYKNETVSVRIRVCNYSKYDIKRNGNETEVKRKRNGSETETTPTEESNKGIREEENILSASAESGNGNGVPFYETKKKRKLTGERLRTFEEFWKVWKHSRGKAEAADVWYDMKLTKATYAIIMEAAEHYAKVERPELIRKGMVPKWAQGWLSGKRWEDSECQTEPEYWG